MEVQSVLIAIASMSGLGLIFSAGLSVAQKRFYVEEDKRIPLILEYLPGANCGGCGYPGCTNFADNLVNKSASINGCPVSDDDSIQELARILGIEVEKGEKLIARIMCQGGYSKTAVRGEYDGIRSCTAAMILGGSDRLCSNGCFGFGDCVTACPFDAIKMGEDGIPIVNVVKCTGCGKCVEACHREVIELHPEKHKLFIFCKNEDAPKDARKVCIAACVGCGICVRAVEEGQINMENNLARIDYQNYGQEAIVPTEKCPTKAINIIDDNVGQA